MGPKVQEFERARRRAPAGSSTPSRSRTALLRSTSRCWRSGSARETRFLVPAYTFPATANVVRLAGATPVLVDIDPTTFNLDLGAVYDAVTPRTKAVLAVHLFGRPLDWEELQNAVPPEVLLIEDAAGALGARWRGMPCGGLGTMGCLSFHPRKIVSTGEGGAVTTQTGARRRDPAAARPRCSTPAPTSLSHRLNYRLADILCAIGIPQLRRLDELLAERTASRTATRAARRCGRRPGRRRGRHARLAGVRDPAGSARRGARDTARGRGSRCRSGRTRCTSCPRIATRGRSRAPTRPSTGRSRCRFHSG